MKRRNAARVLACSLALVIGLTACGGTKETPEAETPVQEAEDEASEELNYWDMLDSVSDTSELPDWTGDTLTVNVWYAGGTEHMFGQISDSNVTFKELERVTGVKFDLDNSFANNGDSVDAKLPKIVASKQFPTLVVSWGAESQMADLYEHGYLADLTEFYNDGSLDQIQRVAPTDVFGDTYYAGMHDEDGNYYMIPYDKWNYIVKHYVTGDFSPAEFDKEWYAKYLTTPKNATNQNTQSGVWVRDDILQALYPDALTMDEIENIYIENGEYTLDQIFDIPLNSTEDFFNLLRDIQEEIASGDYKGLDGKGLEVTYGPNSDTDNWNWMFNLPNFVGGNLTGVNYFTTIDRNAADASSMMVRSFMTDEMVDFMRDLNGLVNEDVISQNSLVDNSATFDEKCLNGHYAVYYGDMTNRPWDIDSGDEGWRYRPVWVKQELNDNYGGYASVGTPGGWGIFKDTLSDEQLEQLVHCINYLYSEVGAKNFVWGPASAGLFEEDENGVRAYVDEELIAALTQGEDNDGPVKYGLMCGSVTNQTATEILPLGPATYWNTYGYAHADTKERQAINAKTYYNPGAFEEWSIDGNSELATTDYNVYGFGIANVEDLKTYWDARTGFENQMKRLIATTPDNFDKELDNLLQYSIENGMTDEALQEFGEKFYEANANYMK